VIQLTSNILYSILVILSALWFHIVWIPVVLLPLIWLRWYYQKKVQRLWDNIRNYSKSLPGIIIGTYILGLGLIGGLLLYRFGIELISVPSLSMEKAIGAGDYIIVNKLVPGPRRFPEDTEKYFRMKGTDDLKRGDIVLFNFPEGDTILENRPDESYYYLKRHYNNFDQLRQIRKWGNLVPLNVKNRPRFVKRLTALAGDTIELISGMLHVNSKEASLAPTIIKKFKWMDSEQSFKNSLDKIQINEHYQQTGNIVIEMTIGAFNQLPNRIKGKLSPALLERNIPDRHIFPFNTATGWNSDYLGPVRVPSKGDYITLTSNNYEIYKRAIKVYEKNDLKMKDGKIFINGKPDNKYCFKFNYYWVMGDNRPHSFDSRFWGFLPENHLIGKIPEKFVNLDKN
jgi:signal peptidase I